MDQQPIWKITLPDALDRGSVEDLLTKLTVWHHGGTGLQLERIDVSQGRTGVFLSGSEADAQTLVASIAKHRPKLANRLEYSACTVKELHKMGKPGKKSRSSKAGKT